VTNNSINQCYVVDNPEQLTNQVTPCDVHNPYQHRFRFNGSYELPWGGVQLAAVYQDLPGPLIAANRTYTSAEINAQATGALGRNLRLATRTIDIAEPFSLFGDRVRQLDMRVSKLFRFGAQRSRPTGHLQSGQREHGDVHPQHLHGAGRGHDDAVAAADAGDGRPVREVQRAVRFLGRTWGPASAASRKNR
jgi:hypothetical protein